MGGDSLGVLQRAAGLEVGGDAGGPEGFAGDFGWEPGCGSSAIDHPEDIASGHAAVGEPVDDLLSPAVDSVVTTSGRRR